MLQTPSWLHDGGSKLLLVSCSHAKREVAISTIETRMHRCFDGSLLLLEAHVNDHEQR